eukprot:INCI19710.2.p1 GENE.INCI19710.2~~INCI19710.2.p1  ORF type:complete len:279 (-),score=32.63 INCI19710.2:267-1103(-)
MSRRRSRVSTGSTNLPQLTHHTRAARVKPQKPNRLNTQSKARLQMRNVFPPRVKPASPKQGPAYPPLKNIHAVPNPVDYDRKLGFTELSAQKCRTRADLHEKHRRGRLPGLTAVDLDDDGVIDTTEIRLAAVLREMDGAEGMSEADKIRHGRKLLAKELIMDMDQMEYLRMGKQFENVSREAAVDMIATDPNFRQHFNAFLIKKSHSKVDEFDRSQKYAATDDQCAPGGRAKPRSSQGSARTEYLASIEVQSCGACPQHQHRRSVSPCNRGLQHTWRV